MEAALPQNPKGMKRLAKEIQDMEKDPIEDIVIEPN